METWQVVWELPVKNIDQLFATHFISISIPRQYCQVKYVRGEKIRKEITSLWCRLINSTSSTTTVTQWSQSFSEVTYTIFGWNNFWRSILDSWSIVEGVPHFMTPFFSPCLQFYIPGFDVLLTTTSFRIVKVIFNSPIIFSIVVYFIIVWIFWKKSQLDDNKSACSERNSTICESHWNAWDISPNF